MALSHRKVHRAAGHAQVRQRRAFTRPASTCRSGPHGHRLNTSGRLCGPIRLQSIRFHVLLNSLFKVLFNFPSRYLFAIGLVLIFSLRWSIPPPLDCITKQPDSRDAHEER